MKEDALKEKYRQLVQELKQQGKEKGAKITNEFIGEALGYERSYFSTLVGERGIVTEKHIKDLMLHFPTIGDKKSIPAKLEPKEDVNSERSLQNLTESNKVLAEANKTLAEANKTLAEANHVISKNHDELIQLTKMIVGIHGQPSKREDLRAKTKKPTHS